MIANKGKVKSIEEKLGEFESKLRREMMAQFQQPSVSPAVFDRGHKETIHVSLGALAASAPPPKQQSAVAGD